MRAQKRFKKLIDSPNNVRFGDAVNVVKAFGFKLERVRGSHHLFAHPDLVEQLNMQNVSGKAKPYQIMQFLRLVERYNLTLEDS